MKGRESGMPEKGMWEKFFSPASILATLGLNGKIKNVVEFGCGYGTFTIPAAKVAKGKVYAIDIDPEMTVLTRHAAERNGLNNIETLARDFMAEGTGIKDAIVDYVMLFNILHIEQPDVLLKEAYRILRSNGRLGVIHWNYDSTTPRGPSMEIRVKPEKCIQWAREAGFIQPRQFDLKPYHYGIVMSKAE
jgi:ubiquinone/menaquinone biosynthesis C-methylase UbiE